MTTSNDGWVAFADRKPEALPKAIWCCNSNDPSSVTICKNGPYNRFTHWMPAELPSPPREPTQTELDERAMQEWEAKPLDPETYFSAANYWHAALVWEREQVRALLISSRLPIGGPAEINEESFRKLTARVGLNP